MDIGDRVVHKNGSVGHVEKIEDYDGFISVDVRWLTPKNVPSACVGMCCPNDLQIVSESVIPMPRSEEWWQEARDFCSFVESVLLKI